MHNFPENTYLASGIAVVEKHFLALRSVVVAADIDLAVE